MTSSDLPMRHSGAAPAHRPSSAGRVKALWRNRGILWILVIRDLKIRYSDSVLGYVWTLLEPLMLAIVYWFVFGFIIARGSPVEQPYLLWLLTGILPFQWTLHVLNDSGRLLGNDAKLVTASSLPRETWVIRTVLSRFVEFFFTLPITAAAAWFFGVPPHWWLALVPVAFLVQGIYNTGLGLLFSPLCMLYPDVQRLIRVFSTMYRYISPVVFGVTTFAAILEGKESWPSWMLFGDQTWPVWALRLFELNPLTGILDIYHRVFFPNHYQDTAAAIQLEQTLPTIGPWLFGVATIGSIITLLVGWHVFNRLESRVLKEM